jgi:hypothetical protein
MRCCQIFSLLSQRSFVSETKLRMLWGRERGNLAFAAGESAIALIAYTEAITW